MAAVFAMPVYAQMGGEDGGTDGGSEDATDMFKNTDSDGDGKVTLDEVKKARAEFTKAQRAAAEADDYDKAIEEVWEKHGNKISADTFLMWDGDDDLTLTRKEYDAGWNGESEAEMSDKDYTTLGDVNFDEIAAEHDTDKDGKIGRDELVASAKKMRDEAVKKAGDDQKKRRNAIKAYSVGGVLREQLVADLDGDGVLTREEYRTYAKKYYTGEIENYQPTGKNLEVFKAEMLDEVLMVFDADKDGLVSRKEIEDAGEKMDDDEWKKLDKDGDGKLDKKELSAALFEEEADSEPSEPPEPKKEEKDDGEDDDDDMG